MPLSFLRVVVFLAVSVLPALAQRGDRKGEVQKPPAASIKVPPAPALAVEDALKTFKLAPGFHLEVVAADPLVSDPVAIQFGPDGRLWVLEMRGYMPNVDGDGEDQPVGDVVILEDTDGDGRMDKRTVFLDRLVLPRAISLVDDGLLVAEPPHLWFCRDRDGDGAADEKIEVAANYGNTTNPEHNANGLMWALDNWIYSANLNVRFHYDGGGKFSRDTTISRGQWGITQDDVGRLYYNSNSDPLRVDLIPSAYLKRNALLPLTGDNVQLVPANLPVWPGRVTPGVNRGYKTLREDGTLAAVTAACAPVIVRSALFPPEFAGNALICEPAGNLVKRIVLEERPGAIAGRNAYERTEFLTSTDERFRPVNLANGPDGAIYLVDMYRGVIQHRTYVTSFLRKQIEERQLEKPLGMGRIYRIVPDGAPPANFKTGLAQATTTELVQRLGDANGWTRDTVQRLLVTRHDPAAAKALRKFATTAANPLGRVHALWTLDGLGALDKATVLTALENPDARVCAAGVRLAEKFLAPDFDAKVFSRLTKLAARPEPAVRLQLALSLSQLHTPAAEIALRKIALAPDTPPLVIQAIASGFRGREAEFAAALAHEAKGSGPAPTLTALAMTSALKAGDAANAERILALARDTTTAPWARRAVLDGVERFLPKMSDGKLLVGFLHAEPQPLVALAATEKDPEAVCAQDLLLLLKWPGKKGPTKEPPVVVLTESERVLFEKGRTQFAMLCAACHQPEGQGLAGLAPPLVNSRWVLEPAPVSVSIVLSGKAEENMVMPSLKAVLDDEAIAAVLTYVRNSWGHGAGPVAPELVARIRAGAENREEPWSNEDLEQFARNAERRGAR